MFLDEISISLGVKQIALPNACIPLDPLRAWVEKKGPGKENFHSLPSCWAWTSVFCQWTGIYTLCAPGPQVFGFIMEFMPLAFLDLQFGDGRYWEFLASVISQFFIINLFLYIYVLFFWEPWLIQLYQFSIKKGGNGAHLSMKGVSKNLLLSLTHYRGL